MHTAIHTQFSDSNLFISSQNTDKKDTKQFKYQKNLGKTFHYIRCLAL